MKEQKNSCTDKINELCEQFKDRGIADKVSADAGKNRKKAEKLRKTYSTGERSPKSKKYKTGSFNGTPYVSSDDFARYYNDLRNPQKPNGSSRDDKEYREAEKAARKSARLQSKKERRLAIMKLLGTKLKAWGLFPLSPKKFIEESNKGFDEDDPQNRESVKGKTPPARVVFVIAVISFSLLLVVTSSVMVSRAQSDVANLESKLSELGDLETKLSADLEVKNNMVDIKKIAEEKYGMVGAEYVASRYVYIERDDKIQLGNSKADRSALIRLLEAIGLRKE